MNLIERICLAALQGFQGFMGHDYEQEVRAAYKEADRTETSLREHISSLNNDLFGFRERISDMDGELAGLQVAFVETEEQLEEAQRLALQERHLKIQESTAHLQTQLWAADLDNKLKASDMKVKMYQGQVTTLREEGEAARAAIRQLNSERDQAKLALAYGGDPMKILNPIVGKALSA